MSTSSSRNSVASFFIARPVFAIVLAIATLLGGVMGINSLSISQYPEIAPITIRISATYPGATAEAVENSVTRKIERRDDRPRRPALHGIDIQHRLVLHLTDLRQRDRSRTRAGRGPEQAFAGRIAAARRRDRAGRHREPLSVRHPDDRQHHLARRPLHVRRTLRHHVEPDRGTDRAGGRRRLACSRSAPAMPCASGSIRRQCRNTSSCRAT